MSVSTFRDIPTNEIVKALYYIPEEFREANILKYAKGMKDSEIMRELNLSEARLRRHLMKGRKRLEKYFQTGLYAKAREEDEMHYKNLNSEIPYVPKHSRDTVELEDFSREEIVKAVYTMAGQMRDVAILFFEQRLTRKAISKQLNISADRVSRLVTDTEGYLNRYFNTDAYQRQLARQTRKNVAVFKDPLAGPIFLPDPNQRGTFASIRYRNGNVRNAIMSDLFAIKNLLDQLDYPDTYRFLERKMRLVLENSNSVILVYEDEGKVVAFMAIDFVTQLALEGDFTRISYFAVDGQYRNKGVGKEMEKCCVELASQRKCDRIELHCHERRTEAHRFYHGRGYSESPKYFIKRVGE